MPGIDSRSAGIEKGQVENRPKFADSLRSCGSKSDGDRLGRLVRLDGHGMDLFQSPKPGRLPLGELPRAVPGSARSSRARDPSPASMAITSR